MKSLLSAFICLFTVTLFAADKRPNIIFLLTDDQRYDSLGCMGGEQVKTPHIDKLASQGVIFDRHFENTSICMGSRACIMTGMYEYKNGCNFNHGPLGRNIWEKVAYPMVLKRAGYTTGFVGKFGFAVKDDPQDDSNYHYNEDLPIADFDHWYGWPAQGQYSTAENEFVAKFAKEYPHTTAAVGAASCEFLDKVSGKGKPFVLSVSFKAPHGGFTPDPQYDHIYKGTVWKKPPNYDEAGASLLPPQPKTGRQYRRIDHFKPEKYQGTMKKYHQLIYGVDQAVGMIMRKVEELGIADDTVIIYTTDNGYSCGSFGFSGKVLPYEGGSRGPLIIVDHKQTNAGKRSGGVTGSVDMAATILDYAGIKPQDGTDGLSLRPMVENPDSRVRESMPIFNFWGSAGTQEMTIVTDEHKYIFWSFNGDGMEVAEELYHNAKDEYEMNNLAESPEAAPVLEKMRKLYDTALVDIKENAIKGNNYEQYGVIFDRNATWEERKALYHKGALQTYESNVNYVKQPKENKPRKPKGDKKKG